MCSCCRCRSQRRTMGAVIYNEDEQQTGLNELGMESSIWKVGGYGNCLAACMTSRANNKG